MEQHQFLFSLSLVSLLFLLCTKTLAESPAPAPAHHSPTNVIKILKKAGDFKTFIRLLKKTQLDSNLNSQLGDSNNGLTIFAPSDSAFSSLKSGTISSLTHQQQIELVQFHIIPSYIPKFDSSSSPLKTHAGSGGRFLLNVTSNGGTVNITTGLTNTTIAGTVYVDKNLAIYKVDKVLLPLDIFTPMPPTPAPAPAPAKAKSKKKSKTTSVDDNSDDEDASAAKDVSKATKFVTNYNFVYIGLGMVATILYL